MEKSEIFDELRKMRYEVYLLQLGDADCIIIRYKASGSIFPKTVVVDAGNVGDSDRIKKFLYDRYGTRTIDLAVCTHPDKDHKGGFFDLMDDDQLKIKQFWAIDPYLHLEEADYDRFYSESKKKEIARRPFNHPSDKRNLIKMAEDRGIFYSPSVGDVYKCVPLTVVGPTAEYYYEAAKGMLLDFQEIKEDPDTEIYDEHAKVDESDAKSIIDTDNDTTYTNQSSLILLLEIPDGPRFLLTGDASCQSLTLVHDMYGKRVENCILKVPHHGSKHNMTTELIDKLKPSNSAISAKGSRKHPNKGLVYWLSKYCNVYSTHKGEFRWSDESSGNPAIPLRAKRK